MKKLTLDDLRKLREEQKNSMSKRESEGKEIEILIGMGTCGIAAGAKESFSALLDEIEKKGLTNVTVKQTGCMGFCDSEPTVEIHMPGMPDVIYGNVKSDVARKIVEKHIIQKTLLNNLIQDKPSTDILGKKGA